MNTAGRDPIRRHHCHIAMLGMFALGVSVLYRAAVATCLGVLLVLAASLTLLPALLAITDRKTKVWHCCLIALARLTRADLP